MEDGGSLVFQTDPLDAPLEVLGAPEVELEIASDQPVSMVAVRLSDMRPDHQLTRVTYGLLNLTHRNSARHPEPLEPGRRYRVRVPLNFIAQRFPAGHRLRISISTVYWPLAWPSPESTRLSVWTGLSRLYLPFREARQSDTRLLDLGEPRGAAPPDSTMIKPSRNDWRIGYDLAGGDAQLEVIDDRGTVRLNDIDLTVSASAKELYKVTTGDFSSVRAEAEWERKLSRDDWKISTYTRTRLEADTQKFYVTAELDAFEGETRIACKSWHDVVERDFL